MDRVREQLVARGLGKSTVRQYLAVIDAAERYCVEQGTDLRRASPLVVAGFADSHPLSWSSRKQVRTALGHYWAITKRKDPPLRAIRVPPKPDMVCRALDEGDARVLAKAARARGDLAGLAVLLTLYLALRRAEVAGLRWSNFDAGGWMRIMGKGDRQGDLPVHPHVVGAMAAAERVGPWVFPGRTGVRDHVAPATIWHWHRLVAAEAGVGLVPPHRGRHTCLATANDTTGDLRSTQSFARHTRPETTAGYTRTTTRKLLAVMRALDYDAAARVAGDGELGEQGG